LPETSGKPRRFLRVRRGGKGRREKEMLSGALRELAAQSEIGDGDIETRLNYHLRKKREKAGAVQALTGGGGKEISSPHSPM